MSDEVEFSVGGLREKPAVKQPKVEMKAEENSGLEGNDTGERDATVNPSDNYISPDVRDYVLSAQRARNMDSARESIKKAIEIGFTRSDLERLQIKEEFLARNGFGYDKQGRIIEVGNTGVAHLQDLDGDGSHDRAVVIVDGEEIKFTRDDYKPTFGLEGKARETDESGVSRDEEGKLVLTVLDKKVSKTLRKRALAKIPPERILFYLDCEGWSGYSSQEVLNLMNEGVRSKVRKDILDNMSIGELERFDNYLRNRYTGPNSYYRVYGNVRVSLDRTLKQKKNERARDLLEGKDDTR